MEFLDEILSKNAALIAAVVAWLWHKLATDKTERYEQRIREAARAALSWTLAAAEAGNIDIGAIMSTARARAKDRLASLEVPLLQKTFAALLDHELELAFAAVAEAMVARDLPTALKKLQATDDLLSDPTPPGSLGPLGGGAIQFEEVTPEQMAQEKAKR